MRDPNFSKPRFNVLKDMIKNHRKANSQAIASRDPMKFIRDNKSMSINGVKGVAFNKGGKVR